MVANHALTLSYLRSGSRTNRVMQMVPTGMNVELERPLTP